jgi:tetratricopeptide (TPR) repeat protein
MLVNDYGSVHTADAVGHSTPQRFGRTVALGLHFPLLERCLESRGFHVAAPPGDEQRPVHTRLIGRARMPLTQAAFAMCFARTTELELDRPTTLAREHFIAGRHGEALDAYRDALSTNPGDWQLLGEVAEFVGLTVRDFSAGEQIVRRALELNAWTSAWLWNVLGDCLFCLERYLDAHAAFLEAHRIDANDPRTNYNLSQTHALLGETDAALVAIARALSRDTGLYRARLLQQQEQVLAALVARTQAEHAHVARRLERLGAS